MRHESLQIFCLAIPGVLISTSLTALFAKAVYPTFSWNVAFLFGAM
jgi:NhaP-type Na+/H+ or K+/H+ antiporter